MDSSGSGKIMITSSFEHIRTLEYQRREEKSWTNISFWRTYFAFPISYGHII